MSHFSFCKMSQCRPNFFIVKHKTAHICGKKSFISEQYSTVNGPAQPIAAHKVMFPSRWPGTSTMARWPMTFLPRRLLFTRLNPTSSMNMYSYSSLAVSCSWIRWNRQHDNASYSMDTDGSTQWATVRHCRKGTILDYRYNTCMCQC